MENRIKKVMGDIFNIDVNSINDKSSSDSIENWDSLKHMNLLVALEEEFDVEFDDVDLENLLNFQLIHTAIRERIDDIC
jgi:acyl carrier protein